MTTEGAATGEEWSQREPGSWGIKCDGMCIRKFHNKGKKRGECNQNALNEISKD